MVSTMENAVVIHKREKEIKAFQYEKTSKQKIQDKKQQLYKQQENN